jgi:hypothetical protein
MGYETRKGRLDNPEFPDEIVERKNRACSAPRAEISPAAGGNNLKIPRRTA